MKPGDLGRFSAGLTLERPGGPGRGQKPADGAPGPCSVDSGGVSLDDLRPLALDHGVYGFAQCCHYVLIFPYSML